MLTCLRFKNSMYAKHTNAGNRISWCHLLKCSNGLICWLNVAGIVLVTRDWGNKEVVGKHGKLHKTAVHDPQANCSESIRLYWLNAKPWHAADFRIQISFSVGESCQYVLDITQFLLLVQKQTKLHDKKIKPHQNKFKLFVLFKGNIC